MRSNENPKCKKEEAQPCLFLFGARRIKKGESVLPQGVYKNLFLTPKCLSASDTAGLNDLREETPPRYKMRGRTLLKKVFR